MALAHRNDKFARDIRIDDVSANRGGVRATGNTAQRRPRFTGDVYPMLFPGAALARPVFRPSLVFPIICC